MSAPALPGPCPRCTGMGDAHYLTCPALRHERPQICTADDLTGGEPCLRAARWVWQPDPADHPAFLCNAAHPFVPRPTRKATLE